MVVRFFRKGGGIGYNFCGVDKIIRYHNGLVNIRGVLLMNFDSHFMYKNFSLVNRRTSTSLRFNGYPRIECLDKKIESNHPSRFNNPLIISINCVLSSGLSSIGKEICEEEDSTQMTIKVSKPIPDFPTYGLLPKEETEASTFLKKYPEYDGRDVVIAILDTGIDPGAVGLQTTTEGKPKIIDIIDCTGSGDVITKTVVKPTISDDGNETLHTIQGLSGRSLIIDPTWKNPSGEFRVGIKRAYELFPKPLVSRLQKERRQEFDKKHHLFQAEAQQNLAAWQEAHPSSSSSSLSETDSDVKADLEAKVELLKDSLKNYNDPGIILDIVTFYDGADWRVVVDVDESGDLRGQPPLTDYRKERQYHTFSQEDMLNFSVNIYDDGDTVCIVTASGSHGTHVAAITAAHHPDEPALNGIAPGAQIVSLKIGDNRLGSMETGAALARAAIALVETKTDVANMSYGEATAVPDYGHFIRLIRDEVVGKHGCIFLSSAGNNGPALSTTGSPGGTSSGIIGVGAYVSRAMVQAEYALLESVPERAYTWSSQGPTTDGDIGVAIYAPGGAITSTPLYSLTKAQLMNGTSMSSPNATGCVALLLSGLKAEDKKYTPYRIRNALVNSAKPVNENFDVGLLQVEKTWDYLKKFYDRPDQDVVYEVRIPDKPKDKRGIYLRESYETASPQLYNVSVKPKFMKEIEPTSGENNSKKFEFESRLALISTQPWVRVPDFLLLGSQGRVFEVKVDPSQLTPGELHFAEVQGYDTTCSERGPLFKIPVVVTKPSIITNGSKITYDNWAFGPGHIERRFLKVPEGATYADVTIKFSSNSHTSPARFWLHMIQLLPQRRFTNQEHEYYFALAKGSYGDGNGEEQIEKKRFSVRGGVTIEICLAQFWSSLGNHNVSLEFVFHGIQIANNTTNGGDTVYINGGDSYTRLDIVAPVRREDEIYPSISFDTLRKTIRPTESSLKPLGLDRDVLPDSRRIYSLTLTYKFSTSEKNTSITPRFPAFFGLLYDSYFEDFFAIIYNTNKKVIGYLDIYAKTFKLETKGDYVILAQVRHQSQELLEKLTNTTCFLDYTISKKVSLEIFGKLSDVFVFKKSTPVKSFLEKGERQAFFVGSPNDYSVYPKEGSPGDLLLGKLNFINSAKIDGGQYYANLVIPPAPIKPKSKEEKPTEELANAIRDLQISHLKKLSAGSDARAELLKELEESHPDHLPLYITKLELLLDPSAKSDKGSDDESATSKSGNMTPETATKAQALAVLADANPDSFSVIGSSSTPEADSESNEFALQFEKTWKALAQWLDSTPPISDFKNLMVYITRERRAKRFGSALKALNKYLSDTGLNGETAKDYDKALELKIELLKDVEWNVWETYERKWKLIRIPPGGHAPF
ncbi:15829_t:CDS:10 [Acaulospora morrowiae]|uniref:Tripeptidyl-peptidase 2 n=1 Tax=Acaulospora morrowiae TaxID=94023 RepID=A0A9N8VMG2_9GLOM|nr:15829_t:CDS:10 [Acaulospora morrowiae]